MAIEGTPSSQKPVQVAKQVMQALVGAVAPAESLDSLAQLLAALFWDKCYARCSGSESGREVVPDSGRGVAVGVRMDGQFPVSRWVLERPGNGYGK